MVTASELRSLTCFVKDAHGARAFAACAGCSILWMRREGAEKAVVAPSSIGAKCWAWAKEPYLRVRLGQRSANASSRTGTQSRKPRRCSGWQRARVDRAAYIAGLVRWLPRVQWHLSRRLKNGIGEEPRLLAML
jgi:hypothetical protein